MFLISKLRLALGSIVEVDIDNGLFLSHLCSVILFTSNSSSIIGNVMEHDIVYDIF